MDSSIFFSNIIFCLVPEIIVSSIVECALSVPNGKAPATSVECRDAAVGRVRTEASDKVE
jgi:hypothetical protein